MPSHPKKSLLLKHGYWSYPDPVPAIRKALTKHEELLEEFEGLYDDPSTPHDDFVEWASKGGVPERVRTLVASAAPEGGYAEGFDQVVVATGSGSDVGSMVGWSPVLLAQRKEGVITYSTSGEDGVEPADSEEPLDEDDVYEFVAGDPYYPADESLDAALGAYLRGEPTLENMLEAVDAWGSSAGYSSDFYDLESRWEQCVESVRDVARERAAEQDDDEDDDGDTAPEAEPAPKEKS